jgi:hypothetical protein
MLDHTGAQLQTAMLSPRAKLLFLAAVVFIAFLAWAIFAKGT